MTLPTQNPIPSNLKNDQLFNAEKMDQIVNSDDLQYSDRFGKKRFTFAGLYNVIQNWMTSFSSTSGASGVGLKQGGTVQNGIISVYVDAFGADPTGVKDSSAAVIAAAKSITTMTTSGFDKNNIHYAEVIFGNGDYKIGDVPFFTGVRYKGQGTYATRIIPLSTASYCFTTIGTKNIDQAASSADRLFHSGVLNMSIGCGYQTTSGIGYTTPPIGVGGIFVKCASYMRFENIAIRFLDGCGIDAVELFDSDINNVQMMSVGNARDTSTPTSPVPALRLMPDGDYSSTNAVRLHAIHIEECPKQLHIGKRTRHVFFTGGCKLEGGSTTISNTIDGANGVTFANAELTWQRSDIPMFEMTSGTEGITGSYGLVFDNPVCISAPTTPGYYFHCSSSTSMIQINNLFARDAYLIASGSQIQINGGSCFRCGPYLFNLWGDSVVDGFIGLNLTVGTVHAINLSGTGCVIRNCRFVSAGSLTDATCVIAIGSGSIDAVIENNHFGGTRNYAMILGNTSADSLIKDNKQLSGSSFATFIKNSQPRTSVTNAIGKGGVKDGTVTLTTNTSGTVGIVGQGSSLTIWASGSDGSVKTAWVLGTYELSTLNLVSQIGSLFKTDATGAAAGDGFVYLSKTPNSNLLTITNNSALTVVFKVVATTASLV